MNSSISSFKTELKVIILVGLVVGAMESRQRFKANKPGTEDVLLEDFPVRADTLSNEGAQRVAFLGNSLTQTGYDMPLLRKLLSAKGHSEIHVEKIALTGSSPIEWYHIFDKAFIRRGKPPTDVVIDMSPDGISDAMPAGYRIGWLAKETTWGDVPEVLSKDLPDIDVDGQYLQAKLSPLYADRWDIRVNLMFNLVPKLWNGIMWDGMTWVNNGQIAIRHDSELPVRRPSYSLLNRLVGLAKANNVHVILVAMPARDKYTIDPTVLQIVGMNGGTFLDCRTIAGLSIDQFKDGWHLTPEGAHIFTTFISTILPTAVQDGGSRQ